MKRFDAFAEVIALAQAAVAVALKFDRYRERGVLRVVEELLGGTLRDRREAAQFVNQRVGRFLQFAVGNAFGDECPNRAPASQECALSA